MADRSSLRHQVFYPYLHLIRTRATHPAFHPNGPQEVLLGDERLFTLVRASPDGEEKVLCVHNVSGVAQPFRVNLKALSIRHAGALRDIISGTPYPVDDGNNLVLTVDPYHVLWLNGGTG